MLKPKLLNDRLAEFEESVFSFFPYCDVVTDQTYHWSDRTLRWGWLWWHWTWTFQQVYRGNPTDNAEQREDSE